MSSALLQSKPASAPLNRSDYGALEHEKSADLPCKQLAATGTGRAGASLLARTFFHYVRPLFDVGNARQLELDDVWALEDVNAPRLAFDAFSAHLAAHDGSVLRALLSTYGSSFVLCGLGELVSAACAVFSPVVLHHVIDAFAAPELDLEDVCVWLAAFFASRIVDTVVAAHTEFTLEVVALRLNVALKTLVFCKATRRSATTAAAGADTADARAVDVSNLYTSDLDSVRYATYILNSVWVLPLQIAVAVYMLYNVLGLAAFAGLSVIGVSIVASVGIARASRRAFVAVMAHKDARLKTIKEVFSAIATVKLNVWETQFAHKIRVQRATELAAVRRFLLISSSSIFLLWASPIVVSMASFAVYALVLRAPLTAAKVFTAIALFNAIREPLRQLPSTIQRLLQAHVSLQRLVAFLALDEVDATNVNCTDATQPDDVAIAIQDGAFAWRKDAAPLLQHVNLLVQRGDLVIVYGSVGAGKSTLCAALLGETHKRAGSVFVRRNGKSVAYYAQQPWLQHRSIRANILFGSAFDADKYAKVLDACGLVPDLAGFPGGDATEIGEKGVNLSGGQSARVSLARACYADADVLILDSPLAAVDAVVQSEIFGKCISTLLEHKTVVLVTHNPDIIASGTVNVLVRVHDGSVTVTRNAATKMRRRPFAPSLTARVVQKAHALEFDDATKAAAATAHRLVDDEAREDGRVSMRVFRNYFDAIGGLRLCAILLVIQTLWQGFQISSDLWLSRWTSEQEDTNADDARTATQRNMTIYALLGTGAALMVLARVVTVALLGLRASRTLFDAMTHALLHAPLRFFDANPLGRIVNRYSDDTSTIDLHLASAFGSIAANLFLSVCRLATAVYMVQLLGVLVLPLVYVYIRIARYYLAPSRELARLWKTSDSPVLSHVNETEAGIVVLRAFGAKHMERAVAENTKCISVVARVEFATAAATQWFQLHMQLVGCVVVVVIVSSLVYLRAYLSPGLVGLVFSYALTVDTSIMRLVQAYSYTEILMVSPERVHEYANIAPEGSDNVLALEPPATWPTRGTIDFDNVVFSYKPGASPVLQSVSFAIAAHEKIGIVGRTGAGKSSLTMALFRINELASGRIVIDGRDVASMPLDALRSQLSIVPQAPVLFKGSLRANMDPFDTFTDAQIWDALEKVEMKTQVAALEQQLAHELSVNGSNFSVGERQMLCLARALLTQTRIVVMDEATAAIDHATEVKLQMMIAREFRNATVLTIAHRLVTVVDSDRIMVLRDGRVIEFDAPRTLVKNPRGAFYELANEGGCLAQLIGQATVEMNAATVRSVALAT